MDHTLFVIFVGIFGNVSEYFWFTPSLLGRPKYLIEEAAITNFGFFSDLWSLANKRQINRANSINSNDNSRTIAINNNKWFNGGQKFHVAAPVGAGIKMMLATIPTLGPRTH